MKHLAALLCALVLASCASTRSGIDPDEFGRVTIEGNESIPTEALLEAAADHLRDFSDRGVGKAAIDDAAYRIELHYRSRGFAFAIVDYAIEGKSLAVDNAPNDVRFLVDEGPKVILSELELESGGALEPERMRAIVTPITGEPGDAPFVRRSLNDAASAVLQIARDSGYADARCEVEVLELERETSAGRARIVLAPGLRNVIDAVALTGDVEDGERARDELNKSLGEPYAPRGLASMLARFEEHLRDAGFPDAHAEIAERSVQEGRVRLVVHVTVGERVEIREVRFEGEIDTRGSYLHDLVDIAPGTRYAARDVRSALQRIYASGLFSRAQARLEPTTGTERDLVFDLVELPSLELWVEPGWGSYDGPRARAGLREHNLLGTGWVLRAEGVASAKTRRAETGVTDPVFLIPDLSLDVALQYARREEPSFEFEEAATETSLRRKWSRSLTTTIAYRFKRSNLIADDLLSLDPTEVLADFDVSAIKVAAINDTRDNLLTPRSGARIELSAEWADAALGSEIDFLRGAGSIGLFRELREGTVLASRFGMGAIVPIHDSTEIPLQERYYLGGESSVRSFNESELGPKDAAKEPLGGEAFTLASLELRQALPRNFEIALFGDAGNLQSSYADLFSGEDYRYAIGIGLRYELPVGSLRFDVGWNPNPLPDEDAYAAHFSIGQAF